ncbi:hypothetical protein [Actinocrinis sp.]|uniref:hypothetical protein n=1 Tax=Actinocrinis sp. TaxID=1920516 RepID=UPI002DDD891F|nr:hypothetical protein [Actinocrinis sp.]
MAVAVAALGLVAGPALSATAAAGGQGNGLPQTGGDLGPNVIVFDPGMPQASIQSTLNTIADQQVSNQFGTERYELLFKPGVYGSKADPLIFQVGYYTTVAGLGQTPDQTVINGSLDVYNQCFGGVQTNCNATDNFWREVTNLTINVAGQSGCKGNTEFWAASQAAPLRRVIVNGLVSLMDYCDGSPDYASGGFIADSKFTGSTIINGSQQQYITRNSDLDGWTNGVWNQVFCGDNGAPAQSFGASSGHSGGPAPYTTLATCPVTQEAPYLYLDSSGNYQVFVPSAQHNSSGTTWGAGSTPGTSLSLDSFYVVNQDSTVQQINLALALGDNLLFTPGVYQIPQTIHVVHPNTEIIGLGFPTLVPTNGNVTMDLTGQVGSTDISGLIFDAGPVRSPVLLKLGVPGSPRSDADHPATVHDVFFRVGGATAGSADTAFVDNSDDSVLDDVWIWRADHGAGAGVWSGDQGDTGLVVNGDDVTTYGLAVEHFQKTETVWNGQGGDVLFFQNENPYEVPSQDAWMDSPTQKGYPAFYVAPWVTSFQGYGLGSYTFFNQGVDIHNSMAFQAPDTPGVQFHDILTVFLTGAGGIDSVINGTGPAADSATGGPADVVSYP